MRLLVARCEVRYTGRLTAVLPEAVRLLILNQLPVVQFLDGYRDRVDRAIRKVAPRGATARPGRTEARVRPRSNKPGSASAVGTRTLSLGEDVPSVASLDARHFGKTASTRRFRGL